MSHCGLASAFTLLQFLKVVSALSVPNSGSDASLSLDQPGSMSGLIDLGNLTSPPTLGADAHWYYIAGEDESIIALDVVNGVPQTPIATPLSSPSLSESTYTYRFGIQNLTSPPTHTFSKYDLSRNLFKSQFALIASMPQSSRRGPKKPYPGGHYTGSKYPDNLPGRIEMYLDSNPVEYGMWYQDISLVLEVLFDAQVGNPQTGGLGYYKFRFEVRRNGETQWWKGVHGYFLPA